jgi:hypothetical protein
MQWFKKHYRWVSLSLLVPFLTFGTFSGYEALHRYHSDEAEQALLSAPWLFLLSGSMMMIPSLLGVAIAIKSSDRFPLLGRIGEKQGSGRFVIEALVYAVYMTLVYGVAQLIMTFYGPLKNLQIVPLLSIVQNVTFGSLIFIPANWVVTCTLGGLIWLAQSRNQKEAVNDLAQANQADASRS